MAIPKMSKLQLRMAGLQPNQGKTVMKTAGVVSAVSKPSLDDPAFPPSLRSAPDHPYIAFMSRTNAQSYDHSNNVVVSISGSDDIYEPPKFPSAVDVLYLRFNPTSSSIGWIQTEHQLQLTAFLEKNVGKNIVVHCGEGQIRSPSLAWGIHEAVNDLYGMVTQGNARVGAGYYKFYKFLSNVGPRWAPFNEDRLYKDCYVDARVQHVASRCLGRAHREPNQIWHDFFAKQGVPTT